jgi:hypothetical protein
MAKCRKALSSRGVEYGMGKDMEYCCPRVGKMIKNNQYNTLIFNFNWKAKRVVTNIMAQSDTVSAIAYILMAWV